MLSFIVLQLQAKMLIAFAESAKELPPTFANIMNSKEILGQCCELTDSLTE